MERDSRLRIGPAGWSYEDWKGIVYPPDMPRNRHPLEFLSKYFDMVEVNSSFYSPLDPRWGSSWLEKVGDNSGFKFTFKLWRRFTHERDSWPAPREATLFTDGIAAVRDAGRLGAILVQFPWSFKRDHDSRVWLARVLDAFVEYPLALEIRHASWNRHEVYEELARRRVAFCNIDQPLFRHSIAPTAHVTARVGYVRLHGRNADDWFRDDATRDERYDYLYSPEELRPWIDKIERIRAAVDEAYVVTNNHYRGQAVVNAFELQYGLGQNNRPLPCHLVEQFPRLKRIDAPT